MYDGWWMMDDGWSIMNDWGWMIDDGWWMMNDEWWMMDEWSRMNSGIYLFRNFLESISGFRPKKYFIQSYGPQDKSIWSKIWRGSWFWRPFLRRSSKSMLNQHKTKFFVRRFRQFFFLRRKMKRRESSKTRFGKVSSRSEPSLIRKRSFKVSKKLRNLFI